MRVAIVVNSFPSLSESFIFNKVMGLRKAGFDVTVVANHHHNDLALYAKQLNGTTPDFVQYSLTSGGVVRLFPRLGARLLSEPKQAVRLWHAARARYGAGRCAVKAWIMALPLALGQHDLIHFVYSGIAIDYLDALPLLAPAKLVTSCRGSSERIKPLVEPERGEQLRRLFPLLDRVHCVSADMQRFVEAYGLRSDQVFVNHPSIDATRFRRSKSYPDKRQGPYALLSVGRLHWVKGLEYSLLAVRRLWDEGYDVYYELVGDGPERERLLYTIRELGLQERVRLHGRQSTAEVCRLLEAADVYLLPSLSEGISNAALEAMAMEVPVVSTTAGGMDEAITDGQNGFLVPPRQPGAMAEKVRQLLLDSGMRRRMGKAGRARVEVHFNLQRQIDCFISEYRALVRG